MNNRKINLLSRFLGFAFLLLASSCNKDFLDTKPSTAFADGDVWTDANLIQLNMNDIYNRNPWSFNNTSSSGTAGSVDESRSYDGGNDYNMNNMLMTPDNTGWGDWDERYRTIRECNVFLENVDRLPDDPKLIDGVTFKNRLKGEATFFRAWYYNILVNYFGGVPLIKKSYALTDDFVAPRNTYAECVKFISDECDAAAALLPLAHTQDNNQGRVTKGAALALKARILLYAASDLHNTAIPGAANPELLGYADANRSQRWQAAKDAAKAVIDLGVYSLYQPNPASAAEATKNYEALFTSTNSVEDIFIRYFNVSASQGADFWTEFPNGFGGIEYTGPTSEMVDAYEMAWGKKFTRDPGDSASHNAIEPYKNRDPRFYASVLYEGATFRPRPASLQGIDPLGVLRVGTWEKWDGTKITYEYGLDSRNSAVYGGGYNNTGTTMLKFLKRSTDMYVNHQDDLTWRFMRYSEIILNYAEACIGLGQESEARTYINMIRKKAAMPEITESGAALVQRYRNERRIEMAFENQRFFDVRRWMIGSEAYHPMHGVDVVYKLNPDKTTATIPTITPVEITTGKWDNKAYFMPISRNELNKNPQLVQNPGYN